MRWRHLFTSSFLQLRFCVDFCTPLGKRNWLNEEAVIHMGGLRAALSVTRFQTVFVVPVLHGFQWILSY